MNKIQRVNAVMDGRSPDRPPVSFWYHFGPEEITGPRAVEAHVRHVETYDLDFLKVMNDGRYPPAQPDAAIATVADLDRLAVLGGEEGSFGRHLEVLRALAGRYAGQLYMATTIFNSWSTLRRLTAPESDTHGPPTLERVVDSRDVAMSRLLGESPAAMARALDTIAQSLANFARQCLAAGANGIYLSVRDDWVDAPENGAGVYDRMVRPGDLKILAAAQPGVFNVLHVCGTALDFPRFAGYPAQVINWADRTAGPAISAVARWVRPAICCGVDNLRTMVVGTPDDCVRQVAEAMQEASPRPIMISPGCTFDPHAVPVANLHAIRRAVEHKAV